MELYLVRHAQTDYNKTHRIQGSQIDSELSIEGLEQTRKIAQRLKDIHFDLILSSPLKRTRKTLEVILKVHAKIFCDSVVKVENDLIERDWGSASGMYWKDVDFENLPPDSESQVQVLNRVIKLLESHYNQNSDSKVLIVTHSGVIRALLDNLFPEANCKITNVSLTVFKFCIDGNHKLIMEPCNAHLED
jgi:uncharacterized phosphatase